MQNLQILHNISKHVSLNEDEEKFFLSQLSIRTFARKELILRQGKICNKIFFVESGCLRAYHLSEEGRESTIMFAITDWWITDMNSFIHQAEAILNIETLDQCKLIELRHAALEDLYDKIPKFERFFRVLFQNAYVREQLRALDNITYTTHERYQKFINKYPQIVQKISQKQIASYLGVTPEFLSSVKKTSKS